MSRENEAREHKNKSKVMLFGFSTSRHRGFLYSCIVDRLHVRLFQTCTSVSTECTSFVDVVILISRQIRQYVVV